MKNKLDELTSPAWPLPRFLCVCYSLLQLATEMDTRMVVERVDPSLISRFYWNQSRFLRLAKDPRSQEHFQTLKTFLSGDECKAMGDPSSSAAEALPGMSDLSDAGRADGLTMLPWCKHENCISLETIETVCNDTVVDSTVQRSRTLYV